MSYQLSMLDKCPLEEQSSPKIALLNAVEAAKAAESAGFSRFWVAEHHNSNQYASSAPEILVSYLLAKTNNIRIGTGGVMLQHYSPYKIAEIFNMLASLEPERVDLGIGKAPGGLPASTKALQIELSDENRLSFTQKAELLNQLLTGEVATNGLFEGIAATPKPIKKAQGFLLGASAESAEFAAQLGWQMSYAGHLNGSEQQLQNTLKTYRQETNGKTPQVALTAIITPDEEEAKIRAKDIAIYKIYFSEDKVYNLPTLEAAEEFAKQSGRTDYTIEKQLMQVLAGTPKSVSDHLFKLHQQYNIPEFMLEFPNTTLNERLYAIDTLAYYQKRLT
ncbi:MsnO8 family LLM class oxidoreductase [Ignatzschineria rhizosphaerae]|uniref:MsnO8 family LLM class oxidoreductase n=1 Tax=Ignatzschineria rhizosphaerae TaxID=2923279 RepID=A0ABY3XBS1_9GAMM|nr:MsnO8 family LLM class oxidoreductase [Ignatzschineria rhizosphaerae]UNM97398.1 MsnO8 family LLM class oxidoreductase [Ignatzschineria rhizosphaerae]